MKTTNNEVLIILNLIENRINKLKKVKNSRLTIENWIKIQNNLVEDLNNLVDLEKENKSLKGTLEMIKILNENEIK